MPRLFDTFAIFRLFDRPPPGGGVTLANVQALFTGASGGLWIPGASVLHEDSAGTIAGQNDGVIGSISNLIAGGPAATETTTANKPFLRRTKTTSKAWLESDSTDALTATWGAALGSSCTEGILHPNGTMIWSDGQTLGATANILNLIAGYGSGFHLFYAIVINRALSTDEKAIVAAHAAQYAPQLLEMAFRMTVRTTGAAETFTYPLRNQLTALTVDWGDGQSNHVTGYNAAALTHTYATAGDYTISATGANGLPYFNNTGDMLKLRSVDNWGDLAGAASASSAFFGCANMTVPAADSFGARVTNMENMFLNATSFNQSVANFNTANVTSMANMFRNATSFNQSVANFNTSKVTSMLSMFQGASAFNQSLANFNTENVTTMANMFRGASAFNQSISNFNTSKVTSMATMFFGALAFSQENVDGFLARLYHDRLLRTSAAPALALPTEPSGTYQDVTTPTTGKEYEWQLENGADVTYKWTITY